MSKIHDIETIAVKHCSLLQTAGIETQDQLLERGANSKAREQLAIETGINIKLICKWVGQADLDRIAGIGREFSELLALVDIRSVHDLIRANAALLHNLMREASHASPYIKNVPHQETISNWIEQAKRLPRIVNL